MAAAISQDDFLNDTSQFDLARKKAAEQNAANLQTQKDALARRFASLGNLNSGARLKQEQLVNDQANTNLNNANDSINAQQNSELERRREVVQGQQFQSGEAEKGRDFAANQANLQRQFQTGERLGGQDFASGQAEKQRQFEDIQNQNNRQFTAGQNAINRTVQGDQFNQQQALAKQQLDQAHEQFDKTFGEETRINNANLGFAQQALNKKGVLDQFGSDLSSGLKKYTGAGELYSALDNIF